MAGRKKIGPRDYDAVMRTLVEKFWADFGREVFLIQEGERVEWPDEIVVVSGGDPLRQDYYCERCRLTSCDATECRRCETPTPE